MKPWLKVHRRMIGGTGWRRLDDIGRLGFTELLLISDDKGVMPCVARAAWDLHRPETWVLDAAKQLCGIGWLVPFGDQFLWVKWQDEQETDGARRVREYRERKDLLDSLGVTRVTSVTTVTSGNNCNQERELKREREVEPDKDRETEAHVRAPEKPPSPSPAEVRRGKGNPDPISPMARKIAESKARKNQSILDRWKEKHEQPHALMTGDRERMIEDRIAEYGSELVNESIDGWVHDDWDKRKKGGLRDLKLLIGTPRLLEKGLDFLRDHKKKEEESTEEALFPF